MSAGFTPGPWRVGTSGPNLCPTVGTVGGLMVAMVTYGRDHPTEANARLIAAAPKMYAALAEFEKQWNACGGNSHFGGLFQSVRDAAVDALADADANHWINTSRDQLAKARGDQ